METKNSFQLPNKYCIVGILILLWTSGKPGQVKKPALTLLCFLTKNFRFPPARLLSPGTL